MSVKSDQFIASLSAIDVLNCAILLDVDGTILDIASTPDGVKAENGLADTLDRLHMMSGGALALVSGRPISDLDRIFAPHKFPAVGCHGAELRVAANMPATFKSALADDIKRCLSGLHDPVRGVLVEDKGYTLALHYRLAPQEKYRLADAVANCTSHIDPDSIEILPGKFVFDIKPSQFNKGTAVLELMQEKPFLGRKPIFIGDDVTDESAISVLHLFEGIGMAVGNEIRGAHHIFETPQDVRDFLVTLAEQMDPGKRRAGL